MGSVAPESMVKRVYQCMCSISPGLTAPEASGKTNHPAASAIGREQLIIFLADTLRGTAEERAPLVMFMSQHASGAATVVTREQVAEVSHTVKLKKKIAFSVVLMIACFSLSSSLQFLQDLISTIVEILLIRGRMQGWKQDCMGDSSLGIKLLAEQMCSELKPSGKLIRMFSDLMTVSPCNC